MAPARCRGLRRSRRPESGSRSLPARWGPAPGLDLRGVPWAISYFVWNSAETLSEPADAMRLAQN